MYLIKNVTIPSGINTTPQIITVDFDEDLPYKADREPSWKDVGFGRD